MRINLIAAIIVTSCILDRGFKSKCTLRADLWNFLLESRYWK